MFTMTTIAMISGAALVATSLLTGSSNNTSSTKKGNKSIKDFSYDDIKRAMEHELYGESQDKLNEILNMNGFYEEGLSSYEVAKVLANKAQYGNVMNPSYFVRNIEKRLNDSLK